MKLSEEEKDEISKSIREEFSSKFLMLYGDVEKKIHEKDKAFDNI